MRIKYYQLLVISGTVLLFIFGPSVGLGSEFSLESSELSTSDNIRLMTTDIRWMNKRYDFIYPYSQAEDTSFHYALSSQYLRGEADANQFSGKSIEGRLIGQLDNRLMFSGAIGVETLKSENLKQQSSAKYDLRAGWKKEKSYYHTISYSKQYAYRDLLVPKGIEQDLSVQKFSYHLLVTSVDQIRIQNRIGHFVLSDGNKRNHLDVDVKYKVGPKNWWMWMGAGVEYNQYQFDRNGYWSPRRHLSFGPRVDLAARLTPWLSITHGTNINRFEDENSNFGYGYYTVTALQLGVREDKNIRLGFERIASQQNSTDWTSNQLFLRGSLFF